MDLYTSQGALDTMRICAKNIDYLVVHIEYYNNTFYLYGKKQTLNYSDWVN